MLNLSTLLRLENPQEKITLAWKLADTTGWKKVAGSLDNVLKYVNKSDEDLSYSLINYTISIDSWKYIARSLAILLLVASDDNLLNRIPMLNAVWFVDELSRYKDETIANFLSVADIRWYDFGFLTIPLARHVTENNIHYSEWFPKLDRRFEIFGEQEDEESDFVLVDVDYDGTKFQGQYLSSLEEIREKYKKLNLGLKEEDIIIGLESSRKWLSEDIRCLSKAAYALASAGCEIDVLIKPFYGVYNYNGRTMLLTQDFEFPIRDVYDSIPTNSTAVNSAIFRLAQLADCFESYGLKIRRVDARVKEDDTLEVRVLNFIDEEINLKYEIDPLDFLNNFEYNEDETTTQYLKLFRERRYKEII